MNRRARVRAQYTGWLAGPADQCPDTVIEFCEQAVHGISEAGRHVQDDVEMDAGRIDDALAAGKARGREGGVDRADDDERLAGALVERLKAGMEPVEEGLRVLVF